MINGNKTKPESICGMFGYSFQLMLCHFTMSLVIKSLNFAAILDWSDYAAEIDNRASADDVASPRCERCLCHGNFTNGICHAFILLVTVTDSK